MRGRLRTLTSGLWFYGLVAVLAAELIFFSLGKPPKLLRASPQAGIESAGAIVFDANALQFVASRGVEAYVPRARNGRPLALRLAARQGASEETGARLELTPELTAASAGKRVHLEVMVKPLQATAAVALSLRLEGDGPGGWTQAAMSEAAAVRLTYDFAPLPEGVRAIWFRPITPERADFAFGAQIQSVEMTIFPPAHSK